MEGLFYSTRSFSSEIEGKERNMLKTPSTIVSILKPECILLMEDLRLTWLFKCDIELEMAKALADVHQTGDKPYTRSMMTRGFHIVCLCEGEYKWSWTVFGDSVLASEVHMSRIWEPRILITN
jgi:hypothetical protein